jgi:hypothetical protein
LLEPCRGNLLLLLLIVSARPSAAQSVPLTYAALHAARPLDIDGVLDEPAWRDAPWSTPFVDIEGDLRPRPRLNTRMKMLWDRRYLYIGAELEEPHVWATITRHDAVIFRDNDFEVFIDPDGDAKEYAELELNALNTVWDLFLAVPYRDGGHAENSWDIEGLRTAVRVNGTINRPADVDSGWTVEIAIPWRGLARASHSLSPPTAGQRWRINFSRVEWRTNIVNRKYQKIPGEKEDNWVWSPQGVVDMHQPEHWGFLEFSADSAR